MVRIRLITFFIFYMALGFQTSVAQPTEQIQKVKYPYGYTEQLNVVYAEVNGWQGKLDLYLPPRTRRPVPLVINIHGGGWNKGTKESQTDFTLFFNRGYAVANIEYRLVQVALAPAAIEDARCALNYLINKAGQYHIDLSKIVVMGTSAGGHLALMAGLLENDSQFDMNCMANKKVKVAAIIDEWGITDVWDWAYGPYITNDAATWWLGSKAKDEVFARSVSPLTYVKKSSPPVFIVHGDADPVVSYHQSIALHQKLDSCGVKNEFITVKGGLHGTFSDTTYADIKKGILRFLQSLKL
jgi:acetyl esterase/lipase